MDMNISMRRHGWGDGKFDDEKYSMRTQKHFVQNYGKFQIQKQLTKYFENFNGFLNLKKLIAQNFRFDRHSLEWKLKNVVSLTIDFNINHKEIRL